tara:strand:- start:230 stop:427 length:198 start_codon:yes stop_codon:yes gene_type:complete
MIRAGNRVALIFNMDKMGTVLTVSEIKNQTWMVGGVASKALMAEVQFDDGEILKYSVSELMRIDE